MFRRIEKKSKKIDHDEMVDALNEDVSYCCQSRKKPTDIKKRKLLVDDTDDDESDDWATCKRSKNKSTTSINDADSDVKMESVPDTDSAAKRSKPKRSVSAEASPKSSSPKSIIAKPSVPKTSQNSAVESQVTKTIEIPGIPQPNAIARKTFPSASDAAKATTVALPAQSNPVMGNEDAAEIDCTPDLFAYLVNHSYEQTHGSNEQSEDSVSSSTGATSVEPAPSTSKNQNLSTNNSNPIVIQNVVSGAEANSEFSQGQATNNREQFVRRVARSQVTKVATQPVYHNYGGFRIDLNSAARQSTIRLPNGKIIHVKKQISLDNSQNALARFTISEQSDPNGARLAPLSQQQPQQQPPLQPQPRSQIIQRFPAASAAGYTAPVRNIGPQRVRPAHAMRHPPLVISSVGSAVAMPPLAMPQLQRPVRMRTQGPQRPIAPTNHMNFQQAQMHLQQMLNSSPTVAPIQPTPQIRPPVQIRPPAQIPVSAGANILLGQQPQAHIYSNDPVGRARTQLERQIFNSISICNQIEGKLRVLMNSNAYKNADKLPDIKELYIHLSYLFTFTNGRFQTVHDKCMEDMRRLGFKNDATSLACGNVIDKYGSDVDDDDLEIVEPIHQTIDLDSDDERSPAKNKSNRNANTPQRSIATPEITQSIQNESNENVESGVMLDISSSTENLECDIDVSSLLQINMQDGDEDHGESLLTRMNDNVGIATPPDTESDHPEIINIENDLKLNSQATVCLKPVEKDYPDLMEKAIQKLQKILEKGDESVNENEQEQEQSQVNGNESICFTPDQSKIVLDKMQSKWNDCSDSTKEKPGQEPETVNDKEIIEKSQDQDKPVEVEPNDNQNEHKENDLLVPANIENFESVEKVDNEIEKPQRPQVETTNAQKRAEFNENEARSIEANSVDNIEKDIPNQESHDEITSTSTANEIDVEMKDIVDGNMANEHIIDGNVDVFAGVDVDNLNIDINEASLRDLVDDLVVEIETTQDRNETPSILSDLSDCNQLINDEINNAICTSATLEVGSFLDTDDFENISSPDTFT